MCRPRMTLVWCFFSTLPFLAATPAFAQPAIPAEEFHPDMIKEFAKARFEASEATRHDLAKAQRDAIDVCFQERKRLYTASRNEVGPQMPVPLYLLLETWAERVEAEAALSDKPNDRSAIPASHWLYTWETERITTAMHRANRVNRAAVLKARQDRLADEIKLRKTLNGEEHSAPFLLPPAFLDGDENFSAEEVKELAKAQFEAGQADARNLAQARRDALQAGFHERYKLYRQGANEPGTGNPVTLNLLLAMWAELGEAELALSDKPADRLAVWVNRWLADWKTEEITGAMYRVGRASITTLMEVKSARLVAEIKLLELLGDEKQSNAFAILPAFLDSKEIEDSDEAKEWARAQFAVSQAKRRDLALARRDALELVLRIRGDLYFTGANDPGTGSPVTLNLLHTAQTQLFEAELTLSKAPADRLAACEKDWTWRFLAEEVCRSQYGAGRISVSAYERSRFNRLGAEIRLLEAEAAIKGK